MRAEEKLWQRLDRVHNHIYANEGLSRQQAFEEVIKILFMKIFDEQEDLGHFFVSKNELDNFKSKGKSSTFERRMKDLFRYTKEKFKDVFESKEIINLRGIVLVDAVKNFEDICLTRSANDINGLVFQRLISNNQKAERGQFFTPETVIKKCLEIIKPKPHELVLDPACGGGGFLVQTIDWVGKEMNRVDKRKYIKDKIRGIEINPLVARVAKMGILLAGGQTEIITTGNTLTDKKIFDEYAKNADVILTNPPFGTKGKIRDKNLLRKYQLGYKYKKTDEAWIKTKQFQNGQVPEILFIEKCLGMLKEGGRMAMVLPQGEFENPRYEYVRWFVRKKANITGVIDLSKNTFAPYTSVKTSVLFLEKRKKLASKIYFGKVGGRGFYKRQIDIKDRIDYEFNRLKYQKLTSKLNRMKAKRLGRLTNVISPGVDFGNGEKKVKYIELGDVNSVHCEILSHKSIGVENLPRRASYRVRKGDIIVSVAGNLVGTRRQAVAMVGEEYDGAICSNGFRVMRNFAIDAYYLLYFIKSPLFRKQIRRYRIGSLIPSVAEEDLKNVLVVIPKKDEIERVSKMMRKSIDLRERAKKTWPTL